MTDIFRGAHVLVTGGTGLIGRPLVAMLLARGAKVRVVAREERFGEGEPAGIEFLSLDLTRFENCLRACEGMDYVFHLVGVKGSPLATGKQPASFFVPTILFNTSMMEAARQRDVKWYLFTSTIGVYAPAEVFREDDVWKTFPSPNDRFAGWAKRMGELQAEAYSIEYGWDRVSIVRPANVYGPYDNFHPANAMVIPSLIKRAMDGSDPLVVWGDGSTVRDFIHAEDVAHGMLLAVEKGIRQPLNLGSGVPVPVREIVEVILSNLPKKPRVEWDETKPKGDRIRLMDISRARAHGWAPRVSIVEGIRRTMAWYGENRATIARLYNVFVEGKLI